jgi:L-fuculose-phosphate aldolase
MMMQDLLPHFQSVGSNLYSRSMLSMHGGNLSMRSGDRVCITRSGSRLGYLKDTDLIETALDHDDENTKLASSELAIHRAIYQKAPFGAVVHAHPVHATVISSLGETIRPDDEGGILFIPEVPIVGFNIKPGPGKFAAEIAEALMTHAVVMVYRHGSFARGMSLEEAFVVTELLEISCQMLYMERCIRK